MAGTFVLPHDAKMRINMLLEMQKKKTGIDASSANASRSQCRDSAKFSAAATNDQQ